MKIDLEKTVKVNLNQVFVQTLREKGYRHQEIADLTGLGLSSVKMHAKRFKEEGDKDATNVLRQIKSRVNAIERAPTKKSQVVTKSGGLGSKKSQVVTPSKKSQVVTKSGRKSATPGKSQSVTKTGSSKKSQVVTKTGGRAGSSKKSQSVTKSGGRGRPSKKSQSVTKSATKSGRSQSVTKTKKSQVVTDR
jgi:predicted transcriptional regulator